MTVQVVNHCVIRVAQGGSRFNKCRITPIIAFSTNLLKSGVDFIPLNQLTSTQVHMKKKVSEMKATYVLHGWWRTS
ncbi:trp operon leader peptide [Citrobacter sp. FP75]|uniref:trp operon leader peptide n=1 Tax=Citrobacter sp. FP75 TaxID=1852949 RepID=UPI00406C6C35